MTTFTTSVSGSAILNGSRSWTVSDADYQKCLNYLVVRYTGKDGVAPPQGQALVRWMQEQIDLLMGQTKQAKDQDDAKTIDNPPPLFTPVP